MPSILGWEKFMTSRNFFTIHALNADEHLFIKQFHNYQIEPNQAIIGPMTEA